jgi:hypothetical protein
VVAHQKMKEMKLMRVYDIRLVYFSPMKKEIVDSLKNDLMVMMYKVIEHQEYYYYYLN